MATSVALRTARVSVQTWLAWKGVEYIRRQQNIAVDKMNDEVEEPVEVDDNETRLKSGYANGALFIALNLCDEIAVIVNQGGKDEHLHHMACAVAASVNMAIMNQTSNVALRESMLNAFHVLLANEVVTPAFNAYAFLKQFKKNRGIAGFVILGSLLPLLRFRFVTSSGLLRHLLGEKSKDLNDTIAGRVFKVATCLLCLALLSLDVTWTRWVLRNMTMIVFGRKAKVV